MIKTLYDQATPSAAGRLLRKDEPREAAKRSIERVSKALEKVFADARAGQ